MHLKASKFIKYVFSILLASLTMLSCEKEKPADPEEGTFKITLAWTSDFYTVDVAERAKPGDKVIVEVTPVENVFINKVLYNKKPATALSDTRYSFTMPEKDVKLTIRSSSTVIVEESCYYAGETDVDIAEEGEIVTVAFYPLYAEDIINKAVVNDDIDCVLVSEDMGEYIFTFEMPEGPAVVKGYTKDEYHVIEREQDDNCVIYMLDCINYQGTEKEFCSQVKGKLVHFRYECDLGYDVECKVIGKDSGKDYTGDVYWSLADENHLYQDCWAFAMPDEPVVIKATSIERAVYEGQDFTGSYAGYLMALGENRIITSSDPDMRLDLLTSGAYFVKSDDVNEYDFSGIYTVEDGRIDYDPESSKGNYAISGKILEDDYAFIIVDDLIVNRIDNIRMYLVGKKDFKYTCTTDSEYATRFIVEADGNGGKSWYFIERDTKSVQVLTAEFLSGSSLSEDSKAIMSVDGKPYLKYTYAKGGIPAIKYCGKEAGSYTSDDSKTLTLDGFDSATYDGAKGSYTIESSVVTYTDAEGNVTSFNINTKDWTFKVISDSSDVTLDPVYSTSTAWISVDGSQRQDGTIKICFNSDYSGNNYKEGYAVVKITYMDTGREQEMVGTCNPFVIDEENRTVTLTQILVGTGAWRTERKDLVLNISADGKTLTFQDEVIYSTSSPYIFCYGGEYSPIVSEGAAQ